MKARTVAVLIAIAMQGGGCSRGGVKDKTPTIPKDQVTAFFKAQARTMAAQQQLQADPAFKLANEENIKLQEVVKSIQTTCGTDYNVQIDAKSQDPICVAKPKPQPQKK